MSGRNGKMEMDGEAAGGLPSGLTAELGALIEMMGRGGIADLSLETAAVKIRLRAHSAGGMAVASAPAVAQLTVEEAMPITEGAVIVAPMIGTFYHAPAPGEPPFVEIGDLVEPGQTIGIIEAMKIMNEIPAECSGVVAEFFAADGQPVEYGQPLLRLEPGGGE